LVLMVVCLPACPQRPEIENNVCLTCHQGVLATDVSSFPIGTHRFLDCERCHGSGAAHVRNGGRGGLFIINPGNEPFETHYELCQECHPGQAEQYLESEHFEEGAVRCTDCHNVHIPQETVLPTVDNSLCLACHDFNFPTVEDIVDHTNHPYDPAGTGASRCTPCHMPPLVREDQAEGPHLHSMIPIEPIESNIAMEDGIVPTPPNSCSGIMGCHDGTVPTAPVFDVDDPEDNILLQIIFESFFGED